MGWACEPMLGCPDWESQVWPKGCEGLVPAVRRMYGLPHQRLTTASLCGRAAHSSALGVRVRNAGRTGQLDC